VTAGDCVNKEIGMKDTGKASPPAKALRGAALLLAAATALAALASPALADWRHDRHYRPPPPRHRYYAPPPVVYTPPPVAYAPPPVVYATPGINVTIPLRF
jgi:hypothetical protein